MRTKFRRLHTSVRPACMKTGVGRASAWASHRDAMDRLDDSTVRIGSEKFFQMLVANIARIRDVRGLAAPAHQLLQSPSLVRQ